MRTICAVTKAKAKKSAVRSFPTHAYECIQTLLRRCWRPSAPGFAMKIFQLTLIVVALSGGGWLWTKSKSEHAKRDASISERLIARAEKRDIDYNVEISGDIMPAFQLEVKAEVGGKLKALHVEPGSVVHEGDLLAEIDDRDLMTEREGAVTEIEGAQLSLDRSRRNFER